MLRFQHNVSVKASIQKGVSRYSTKTAISRNGLVTPYSTISRCTAGSNRVAATRRFFQPAAPLSLKAVPLYTVKRFYNGNFF